MNGYRCKYNIQALIEEMEVSNEDMRDLYRSYFNEAKENIKDIEELIEKGDWDKIERVIHNIKGVSVNLNIKDVYRASISFYDCIKNGIIYNGKVQVKILTNLLMEAEKEVRIYFEQKGISL